MADDLYKEIILEHYKNPNNRGEVKGGLMAGEANMLCGDKIKISVKLGKNKKIEVAKFDGGGCAISMAAADILLDEVIGKTMEQVRAMKGEEIEALMGVTLTPARKKCAYLGLEVLKKMK